MSRVAIDDRNSRIQYRGAWSPVGSSAGTFHSTIETGATATFNFHGNNIFVYGTILPGDGEEIHVDFELDNEPAISLSRVYSSDSTVFNELWYQSPGSTIAPTDHTLIVTYRGTTGASNPKAFQIDRIEYVEVPAEGTSNQSTQNPPTPTPSNRPPEQSSLSSPGAPRASGVGTTDSPESSGTQLPTESNRPEVSGSMTGTGYSSHQSGGNGEDTATATRFIRPDGSVAPAGAGIGNGTSATLSGLGSANTVPLGGIVGGVIGGLALIILLVLLLIFLRRRHQRTGQWQMEERAFIVAPLFVPGTDTSTRFVSGKGGLMVPDSNPMLASASPKNAEALAVSRHIHPISPTTNTSESSISPQTTLISLPRFPSSSPYLDVASRPGPLPQQNPILIIPEVDAGPITVQEYADRVERVVSVPPPAYSARHLRTSEGLSRTPDTYA